MLIICDNSLNIEIEIYEYYYEKTMYIACI